MGLIQDKTEVYKTSSIYLRKAPGVFHTLNGSRQHCWARDKRQRDYVSMKQIVRPLNSRHQVWRQCDNDNVMQQRCVTM